MISSPLFSNKKDNEHTKRFIHRDWIRICFGHGRSHRRNQIAIILQHLMKKIVIITLILSLIALSANAGGSLVLQKQRNLKVMKLPDYRNYRSASPLDGVGYGMMIAGAGFFILGLTADSSPQGPDNTSTFSANNYYGMIGGTVLFFSGIGIAAKF